MLPPITYNELHERQRRAIVDFARQPRDHSGRGIVTSVFDPHIASAWVMLSELARLKVDLPVEAFHHADELSPRHAELLKTLDIDLRLRLMTEPARGVTIKPVAIRRSSFQEVMWIDCDSFPLRDPAFLFEDPEYVAKGSMFWRDVAGVDRSTIWYPLSPVWPLFNVAPNDAEEFETGQLLLNKDKCWAELGLTLHFNADQKTYAAIVVGDKDMFRLAWQNLAQVRKKSPPQEGYLVDSAMVPYGFMPYGPFHMGRPNLGHRWGGGTVMVQRDRQGAPLFVHRNLDKFKLNGDNPFNADVPNEAIYHEHVARLRELLKQP
ncbi:MAG: hypothetical protein WDM94_07105 [Bauldia sp.]